MNDTLTLLQLIKNGQLGSGGSGGFADLVALRYSDLVKNQIPVYEFKLFLNNKEIDPTVEQQYNNAGCIPYWFNAVYVGIKDKKYMYALQTSLSDYFYSRTDSLVVSLWDKDQSLLGNVTISFNDKDHAAYLEYQIDRSAPVRVWSLTIGPVPIENIQEVAAISVKAYLRREEE